MKTIKYVLMMAALLAFFDLNLSTVAEARGRVVVRIAPPAPRVVVVVRSPYRDGVWVAGNWEWRHGKHVWIDGRWAKARKGYVWIDGRWSDTPDGWEWIPGQWKKL